MAILVLKDRDDEFEDIIFEFENCAKREEAIERISEGWGCMEDILDILYDCEAKDADIEEYYI